MLEARGRFSCRGIFDGCFSCFHGRRPGNRHRLVNRLRSGGLCSLFQRCFPAPGILFCGQINGLRPGGRNGGGCRLNLIRGIKLKRLIIDQHQAAAIGKRQAQGIVKGARNPQGAGVRLEPCRLSGRQPRAKHPGSSQNSAVCVQHEGAVLRPLQQAGIGRQRIARRLCPIDGSNQGAVAAIRQFQPLALAGEQNGAQALVEAQPLQHRLANRAFSRDPRQMRARLGPLKSRHLPQIFGGRGIKEGRACGIGPQNAVRRSVPDPCRTAGASQPCHRGQAAEL